MTQPKFDTVFNTLGFLGNKHMEAHYNGAATFTKEEIEGLMAQMKIADSIYHNVAMHGKRMKDEGYTMLAEYMELAQKTM